MGAPTTLADPPVTYPALPAAAGLEPDLFRAAMRYLAAPVVVVTVADGPTGFTASSLASVSLAPPLVSFGVDRTAGSAPAVCRAPAFAVNLLGADQAELAARFARRGADRFGPPTRWEPGPDGLPLLTDALGHLVCRRHRVLALGDHWLVVGLVTAFGTGEGSAAGPLLYHDRRYGGFTERRAG